MGGSEFHVTFALEPAPTAKQIRQNVGKVALFAPNTKWKGNVLPTNDLYLQNVHKHLVTNKRSPFQDTFDTPFEDILDSDTPELNIHTICAIAALRSGLDFSAESVSTEMIQTVINSITSQSITPDEQALGKFTRCKLKTCTDTWD